MKLKYFDFKLAVIPLIIFTAGLVSIYSVTGHGTSILANSLIAKQLLWMSVSVLAFVLSSAFGYQRFLDFSFLFYTIILVLLATLIALGPIIAGAQRWLKIMGMNFQPSEFAKLSLILVLSRLFIESRESLYKLRTVLTAVVLLVIYAFLIFQQPDLGSAMILIPIFITMAISARIRIKHILGLIITGTALIPLFWFILKDYQKERLLVFLDPNRDPLGAGYTIIQSKIAIGSGGFLGKGWLKGSQSQFNFLPEGHTDFIFAVFCEEWGFIGAIIIIFLYYLLLKKILETALLTNNFSAKLLCIGIATFIFSHVFINIGMVMGIMPVVGLPLPFLSYGGSNLMVVMVALGIVASIRKDA